jgi:hypothetical protein
MKPTILQLVSSALALMLAFSFPLAAFETPLSDTAVREAYFMGQRHNESMAHFFDKYYKHLPPPKTGPYISSVSFLTPYALLAQLSSERAYGYSAQQAELDHRKMVETVKIVVEIQLTDTYAAVIPNPAGQTSGTPWDYIYRPSSFWRDFQIQVISGKKVLSPFIYTGEPNYICGDSTEQPIALGEYCTLVGATVQLEFLADQFASDSATIQIDPPEGNQVTVDFDLPALR